MPKSDKKLKSINGLNFFGSTINEFCRPAKISKNKIECWVKIYTLVFWFYQDPKNAGKDFFVSNGSLLKRLNNLGNTYCMRTIQKAVKAIETLKLGTITYTKCFKADRKTIDYIKRVIRLDMEKAASIFGCLDLEQPVFKKLPKRDRLKKIIRKRPFVLTSKIEEAYSFVKNKLGVVLNNANELVASFVSNVSNRYLVTNALFKDFKPNSVENEQKKVDSKYNDNTGELKVIISEDEVQALEQAFYKDKKDKGLAKFKKFLARVSGELCYDPALRARLEAMNVGFNNCSITIGSFYSTSAENGGFETI